METQFNQSNIIKEDFSNRTTEELMKEKQEAQDKVLNLSSILKTQNINPLKDKIFQSYQNRQRILEDEINNRYKKSLNIPD